jgi:hypothetical protein
LAAQGCHAAWSSLVVINAPESVQVKMADLLRHERVMTVPLINHADENHKDWPR